MARLLAESLTRSFGSVRAVQGVNLAIEPGEVYGLIGPDGAGKSTTLRMLVGIVRPHAGQVTLESIKLSEKPDAARELCGYMPQTYGLYGDLTVEENLRFFGALQGYESGKLSERIDELLRFVRLDNFKKRRADALSGGMYKKLAIACAIIHGPRLLILDEPTNGVDPVSRRDLWALLFHLAHDGVSIIVSTPYMDEAERCDRLGLIFNGSILREGTPGSIIEELQGRLFSYTLVNEQNERHAFHPSLLEGRDEVLKNYIVSNYNYGPLIRCILREGTAEKGARRELEKTFGKERLTLLQWQAVTGGFEDVFIELQQKLKEESENLHKGVAK